MKNVQQFEPGLLPTYAVILFISSIVVFQGRSTGYIGEWGLRQVRLHLDQQWTRFSLLFFVLPMQFVVFVVAVVIVDVVAAAVGGTSGIVT